MQAFATLNVVLATAELDPYVGKDVADLAATTARFALNLGRTEEVLGALLARGARDALDAADAAGADARAVLAVLDAPRAPRATAARARM